MSANADTLSSNSGASPGRGSAPENTKGFGGKMFSTLAAFPIAGGQACAWFFGLIQKSNAAYSLKTFGAALAALYISFALDLSQPGWAALTVYIVSQPLAGMVLSKSLARAGGTIIGAIMSVVLVATLGGARELFIVAMALWVSGCLYVSVCLRDNPAAYGAMLSGYTAAMIGFSAVLAPQITFDIATARCIEILLGITLATLASRAILPRSTATVFRARVSATLSDMQKCITGTLRDHYDDTQGLAALRKLIADSVALESLRIHAARDMADGRLDGDVVRALQGRLLTLSSLLVSIHDRVAVLRRERPREAAALSPLFARVIERVDMLALGAPARAPGKSAGGSLTSELLSRLPDFETVRRDPELVIEYNIILRLVDLLAQWQEVNRLRVFLFSNGAVGAGASIINTCATRERANIPVPPPEDTRIKQYRDHSLALVASFGAFAAIVLTCVFWIETGWSHGSSAAIFAAVVSCIMATHDNPARGALWFLFASIGSIVCAAVLMLVILPQLNGFFGLALGLGLFLVPIGMLIPTRRFGPLATPLGLNIIAFLSLHNTMPYDFAEFLNSTSALIAGLVAGILCFRLLRPISADWPVRRLTAGMMRDLAQLAASDDPERRVHFETRMLDRISAITLRLRMDNPDDRARFQGSLTVLRVGLNNLLLLRELPATPAPLATATRIALDNLAAHCRQLALHPVIARVRTARAATPLPAFDAAIQAALDSGPDALNTLVALRAIRATLTQHAAFYGLA